MPCQCNPGDKHCKCHKKGRKAMLLLTGLFGAAILLIITRTVRIDTTWRTLGAGFVSSLLAVILAHLLAGRRRRRGGGGGRWHTGRPR